jgi:hypothetical protein
MRGLRPLILSERASPSHTLRMDAGLSCISDFFCTHADNALALYYYFFHDAHAWALFHSHVDNTYNARIFF